MNYDNTTYYFHSSTLRFVAIVAIGSCLCAASCSPNFGRPGFHDVIEALAVPPENRVPAIRPANSDEAWLTAPCDRLLLATVLDIEGHTQRLLRIDTSLPEIIGSASVMLSLPCVDISSDVIVIIHYTNGVVLDTCRFESDALSKGLAHHRLGIMVSSPLPMPFVASAFVVDKDVEMSQLREQGPDPDWFGLFLLDRKDEWELQFVRSRL